MEQYQDYWVKGQCIKKGVRECSNRYEVIKSFLKQYKRPFTVLDIGACTAYFSTRICEDFDATCVAVEGNAVYQKNLLALLEQNDNPRVLAFNRTLSPDDLQRLGEVEHFDVVLALSVIHHFPAPYEKSLELLRKLGDHLIMELPVENRACGQHIVQSIQMPPDGKVIGYGDSHLDDSKRPIVVVSTPKTTIKYAYLDTPMADLSLTIDSTFRKKNVEFHNKAEKRKWHRGINLQTFLKMGGVYPSREKIAEMVKEAVELPHYDLAVWNCIIQGDKVVLIDKTDENKGRTPDDVGMARLLEALK